MSEPARASHHDELLSTRRNLLADPLSVQVQTWMRRAYVTPPRRFPSALATTTLAQMVSFLERAIQKEKTLASGLQRVSKFISMPVRPHYVRAFETVKRPSASIVGTFISMVYARALLLLVVSEKDHEKIVGELRQFVEGTPSFVGEYLDAQTKLDENFIGHLVTAAEIEAQLDPWFDKMLRHSGELFVEAHRPKREKRDPLREPGADLAVLGHEDPAAWWRLPTSVAFAMTVWHQAA